MKMIRLISLLLLLPGLAWGASTSTPPFSPTPNAYAVPFSTVDPGTQLRQAVAKAQSGQTVNLCFGGDSTMTFPTTSTASSVVAGAANPNTSTPNGINRVDGVQYLLLQEFQRQNPGVMFNAYNFGIPGTTLGNYLTNVQTQAQNFGLTWYSAATNWFLYPRNTVTGGCDVTFLSFGLNDSFNQSVATMATVINDHYGFPSKTGTIWITPPSANPAAGAPFNTTAWQAGFVAAGSQQRAVAQIGASAFAAGQITNAPAQPMGVIDMGRWFQGAVLGVDYTDQTTADSLASLSSNPMTLAQSGSIDLPSTDGNFSMDASLGLWSGFSNGCALTIHVGATNGGDLGVAKFILTKVSNTVVGYQYLNTNSALLPTVNGTFTAPTNWTISAACNDIYCSISSNGTTWARSFLRPVAPFIPTIEANSSCPSSTSVTFTAYSTATARRFNPTLSMASAYGQGTSYTAALLSDASSGQNLLTFTPAAIPSQWANGNTVLDLTQQGAIPSQTTITNINRSTGVVTVSQNLASGGSAGDIISAGTCAPATGGNCINHLSSYGLNAVDKAVIRNVNFHLLTPTVNGVVVPTKVDGSGAGTSPTTTISGSDEALTLSVTTGTSASASQPIDTITWNVPYTPGGVSTAPTCGALVATNANAQDLTGTSAVTTSASSTGYVITAGSAALADATTYTWALRCPRP